METRTCKVWCRTRALTLPSSDGNTSLPEWQTEPLRPHALPFAGPQAVGGAARVTLPLVLASTVWCRAGSSTLCARGQWLPAGMIHTHIARSRRGTLLDTSRASRAHHAHVYARSYGRSGLASAGTATLARRRRQCRRRDGDRSPVFCVLHGRLPQQ